MGGGYCGGDRNDKDEKEKADNKGAGLEGVEKRFFRSLTGKFKNECKLQNI